MESVGRIVTLYLIRVCSRKNKITLGTSAKVWARPAEARLVEMKNDQDQGAKRA